MLNCSIKGVRCKFGTHVGSDPVLGRIIGNAEGSSGGRKLFLTPHGTSIETGFIHLSSLTNKEIKRLTELEKSVEGPLYDGKLTPAEIEEADKYIEED